MGLQTVLEQVGQLLVPSRSDREVQTDILLFHFLKDRIHQIGLQPGKESAVN